MIPFNTPRLVSQHQDGSVYLVEGLSGQDDYIDDLTTLYEHLQLCTVETAHPELDIVSFSMTCFFFGIILFQPKSKNKDKDLENDANKALTACENYLAAGWRPSFNDPPTDLNDSNISEFDTTLSSETSLATSSVRPLNVLHRQSPFPQPIWPPPQPLVNERIGLVYLTATPVNCAHNQVGELNIGIILHEAYRGKGYAHQVLEHVTNMAFEERHCHRLQASILDSWDKDVAISLFTQLKFSHEGIRRLSHFDRLTGEWKNVTHYALLATDWLNRAYIKPAPKSLWDELFARHAREREELLRWEDRRLKTQLKRTSSMETILPSSTVDCAPSVSGDESDDDYDQAESPGHGNNSIGNSRWRSSSPSMLHDNVMDLDDGNPFDHPDEHSAASLSPRPPSPTTSIASTPSASSWASDLDASHSDASSEWDLLDHRSEPSTPHT